MAQWSNPPLTVAGQAGVMLDAEGRLEQLAVNLQPDEFAPAGEPGAVAPRPDWNRLFALARLDPVRYRPIAASRGPWGGTPTDDMASWEGPWPDDPDRTLRLHAGARSGRLVYWEIDWKPGRKPIIAAPWAPPSLDAAPDTWITRAMKIWQAQSWAAWRDSAIWVFAIVVAWRNLRSGRGDRRGALRLGAFVALMYWLGGWFLFLPQAESFAHALGASFFSEHLGHALVHGAGMFAFYLALEPYARKLWPRMLVAWSRLLQGRITDPLVGREVLIGGGVAAATFLAIAAVEHVGVATGLGHWRPPLPGYLAGIASGEALGFDVFVAAPRAVLISLLAVLPLVFFRLVLRRPRVAVAAAFVMGVLTAYGMIVDPTQPGLELVGAVLLSAASLAVLLRAGLLAFTAYLWASTSFAVTLPAAAPGSWARGPQLEMLAVLFVVLALAAWTSMAGRPLLGALLDEKPAT
jgi:hypothetical protein